MKIIGKTHDGFLIDVSTSELALLAGFRGSSERAFLEKHFDVGHDFPLQKLDRTNEFLRNLDQDRLVELRNKLTAIVGSVDAARETIQSITLFETLKDGQ
jgi:hypothetical protein